MPKSGRKAASTCAGPTRSRGSDLREATYGHPALEPLQQPIDIVQFFLRTAAIGAAPAEFLLDGLGPLALAFFRHPHVAALVGADRSRSQEELDYIDRLLKRF
jgi:hypothetical protein